jgi:alpha-beta hydrolase superfamily lysophospholipase
MSGRARRPRGTRDLGVRAGRALAAPLLAIAGGAIGAAIADMLALRDADSRFVAVTLGALVALTAIRATRPGSSRRSRAIHATLALPALAALAFPHSTLAVSWLAGGALYLGLDAAVHAALAAWRLGTSRLAGATLGAMAALPSLHLWAAALIVLFNTQLMMAPVRLAHLSPAQREGERALSIETEDGLSLGATYTEGRPGAPGVVLAHGVADSRTRLAPWADRLSAQGYHVVRFDFRAHGASEGAVCTYGQREARDVRAAVGALRSLPRVDRDRVAVVGASMGGGSVLAAAPTLAGVRALVLLAPASRFPPLVHQRVRWLGPFEDPVLATSAHIARAMGQTPMTEWIPARGLRESALPALVLHGTRDGTIPMALSERLVAESARAALVRLPGAGHDALSDDVLASPDAWARVEGFLARELEAARTSGELY